MFIVFSKEVANELIKRGFTLKEIGGNKHNIYYFDDSIELQEAIEFVTKELDSRFEPN